MIDFRIFTIILCFISVQLFAQHQQTQNVKTSQLKRQLKGALRANDHYSQIDFLEELTTRKPDKLKYKYELARAYDEARNYQRALEEYSKSFYGDGEKYSMALFHMGRIMKTREQYELALLYFNRFQKHHNHSKEAKLDRKLLKAEIQGCENAMKNEIEKEEAEACEATF